MMATTACAVQSESYKINATLKKTVIIIIIEYR